MIKTGFNCWSLTLILCLSIVGQSHAIPLSAISWQDQALANCIRKHSESNNWLNTDDVLSLKCHGMDIKDAQQLEMFTQLTDLSLYNNQIKQLDLSALTNLKSLNLAGNELIDIKLTGLNQLETLYLFKNQLNTINLTGLNRLKKLRANDNQITELTILMLSALEKAYLYNNKLKDLKVDGLNNLKLLDVKQNPMPDELYDHYDSLNGIMISHDGNADDWK